MKEQTFDVYEYPIKGANGNVYLGSYTIIAGLKPCGFKGEKKVDTFIATVKAQSLIQIQLHSQGKSLVFLLPRPGEVSTRAKGGDQLWIIVVKIF